MKLEIDSKRRQELGEFFRSRRVDAGVTQRQLAKQLGMTTPQFISNWERGVSLPKLSDLPKISTACKIPQITLFKQVSAYLRHSTETQIKELRSRLIA